MPKKSAARKPTTTPASWNALIGGDKKVALLRHFAYLDDTPGFAAVLKAVIDKVESAAVENKQLIVRFRGQDDPWIATLPAKPGKYRSYPASFIKLVEHHELMSFGKRLHFNRSSFDFGMFSAGDNVYELFGGKARNVQSPVEDSISNQTNWLYDPDPENKNAQGEPAIFAVIHELEDEINPIYVNAGALFLSRLVEKAGWKIAIPRVPAPAAKRPKGDWWATLDRNWQRIFRTACKFPRGTIHDDEPKAPVKLETVLAKHIEGLNCLGLPITSLDPLEMLDPKRFSPELIFLQNTKVTDVSALARFKKLYSLDISGTAVRDVSKLTQLRRLHADRCDKLDFKTLEKLSKLTIVSLRETILDDLRPFAKLEHLKNLNVLDTKVTPQQVRELKKARSVVTDLRPDISDPLRRTVTERASYQPERAVEAGETFLASSKNRRDVDAVLVELVALCEAAESRYLYTDRQRYIRFAAFSARFKYMQHSRDYAPRRSVKTARAKDIVRLLRGIYKHKDHYAEANLEDDSFFSVEHLTRHLVASSFHDIESADVERAVRETTAFEHETSDGKMYIKPR